MTIRLPSSDAAITAPLAASSTAFPGVRIGRSILDSREFRLSPVMADTSVLPSTNSLSFGGPGSGKSTNRKAVTGREIRELGHQAVVIDAFGEDNISGEWAALTRSLDGQVVDASAFTLNPVSTMFPPQVREQLIRSLILSVEPDALSLQSSHALQHALNSPKATDLSGLVDALADPQKSRRYSVDKLASWGEGAAIALSRYTEGSLSGLFDGASSALPPTDLPILSFDFTRVDRNSPAIPSLMAAITCWVEHVWLPQSTAVHRHLVLEEAWQILINPATSDLIQRLLKYSRRAGLSIDAIMHTLSDQGDGRAQDLARLCEVIIVGRLGVDQAENVGQIFGLPRWAINRIPALLPGQAVWKIGPDYIDIIETELEDDEIALTDTSSRRRKAQQVLDLDPEAEDDAEAEAEDEADAAEVVSLEKELQAEADPVPARFEPIGIDPFEDDPDAGVSVVEHEGGDWEMPPNALDALPPLDNRHFQAVQAAAEGRPSEAADLAAEGERQDIAMHGFNSDQAAEWLSTRARIAELGGNPAQAQRLRATVTHMGKEVNWWRVEADPEAPKWHHSTPPPPSSPPAATEVPAADFRPGQDDDGQSLKPRRRTWPFLAAISALAIITTGGIWQWVGEKHDQQQRQEKAADFKGRSGGKLSIDGVSAEVVAHWTTKRDAVIVDLSSNFDKDAKYLRLEADGKTDTGKRKNGWPYPDDPALRIPITDPLDDVTVRVAVGGKTWTPDSPAAAVTVRLSPNGVAYDADTGKRLPNYL